MPEHALKGQGGCQRELEGNLSSNLERQNKPHLKVKKQDQEYLYIIQKESGMSVGKNRDAHVTYNINSINISKIIDQLKILMELIIQIFNSLKYQSPSL